MICDFDEGLICRRCGHTAQQRVRRMCEQAEFQEDSLPSEAIAACPHRGLVLASISAQSAGCGCASSRVEFHECRYFEQPVLKQCAAWAASSNQERLARACPGYAGRTCRECSVPTGQIVLSDTGLGDVTLNCWYPEAQLNVPANRLDVAKMFGARLTSVGGKNLRASWQPELKAREPRIEFRARWYGVTEIRRPAIHLDSDAVAWAKTIRDPGRAMMLFTPQSHQREREWPTKHWTALGEMLAARGVQILMDLGKPDAVLQAGPWQTFVGQPIPRLAALIGEVDLVVTIDSGPAHVAGTMDRPTLLLLGPLLENSYEHMGSVQTIRSARPCAPCNLQPPHYGSACHAGCAALRDLQPEAVATRARRMLTPTRIGVCCLATDQISNVRAITRPNLESYCRLRGYTLHYAVDAVMDRPASWGKIPLLQRHLLEHDWLWWADADLAVTSPERRIEELTDGATGDLLIARDSNGINCGSFLLRNCDWSHDFLRQVWDTTEDHDHCWWEQWAIMQLLAASTQDRAHVQEVRKRSINSYPSDWLPGDFVLHTPGVSDRLLVLQAACVPRPEPSRVSAADLRGGRANPLPAAAGRSADPSTVP